MKNLEKEYRDIKNIPFKFMPVMILAFFSINILSLALPLVMKKIYGTIILNKSALALRYVLGLAFIALLLEAIMRKIKEDSTKWIAAKYEYKLSLYFINKLLSTFSKDHKDSNYVNNIEKIKSITKITNFYATAYYQLFIDVPFMFIFLGLIYIYGGRLVLIPVGLAIGYALIVYIYTKLYFNSKTKYAKNTDSLINHLVNSLERIHFIKASGIEESQITIYKKLIDEVTLSEYHSNRYRILPSVLKANISQMTLFMILIAGGYLISQDQITFAQLTACAMLGGRAVSPIVGLMNFYQQTMDIKILQNKFDQVAQINNQYSKDIPDLPSEIEGAIELIDLQYRNIQTDQDDLMNLKIKPKDFICIDPSTFPSYQEILKKIVGYEKIKSGKILIDSLDVEKWNMHSLNGKIKYLSENVSLYKGNVLENITIFDISRVQNAYQAAALTGLDELVKEMPEGFSTQIDSQMKNYLSPAFMQRLNLSRALLEWPRIIVFDRIDDSMDLDTLELFKWLLGKMKGNTTIIIASWNKEILELGDSFVFDKELGVK